PCPVQVVGRERDLLATERGARVISFVVFVVGAVFVHRYMQRDNVVETLVDTETELKKVTWPTFNETVNSSLIVVAFVVLLTGYLWLSDQVLDSVFRRVLGVGG
ncbi:MAG: preprotein translocase subunit SecE, partial [Planctomycetota bacterium]